MIIQPFLHCANASFFPTHVTSACTSHFLSVQRKKMCGGFTDNKIFPSLKNGIKKKPKFFFSVMETQAKLR